MSDDDEGPYGLKGRVDDGSLCQMFCTLLLAMDDHTAVVESFETQAGEISVKTDRHNKFLIELYGSVVDGYDTMSDTIKIVEKWLPILKMNGDEISELE